MSNLPYVWERIESGDKVRFFQDYYGRQWIELRRGWVIPRRIRVALTPAEILEIKSGLAHRRRDAGRKRSAGASALQRLLGLG